MISFSLLASRLQDIGCLACRKHGLFGVPSDLHHPTSGGRRVSDSVVIPLCPWHHRGVGEPIGPSLAKSKRAFVAEYGSEMELHAWCQRLLAQRFP